jgi:spermidine synthase
MDGSKKYYSLLIAGVTVFFSSACIMILELVAGRLIARHLGSNLYTWTSIIGVVLSGITIGNYCGGRVADRFNSRKALAVIFGISSMACVAIVVMNNLVPQWIWLWQFGLVFRIFSNVALIFLIPSTLLGMISPVVAKMALERGLPVGRTIGDVYAWSAAGSIAGTFAAGFYLIGAIGTIAIIWTIAACLLLMGMLYGKKMWFLYVWATIFLGLAVLGIAKGAEAANLGASLKLQEPINPQILYEDESRYGYIAVQQVSKKPDKRIFIENIDQHGIMVMEDIQDLQCDYFKLYAAVTHSLCKNKSRLATLTIGGGGCVFPRYIEKTWPGSRIDVTEIDPAVTEAARLAFGLPRDASINIHTLDARNYVDDLLEQSKSGGQIAKYDFIYGDAFNGTTIPFQLVTQEFNNRLAQLLDDGGAYIINTVDVYDSGLFLGSFLATLDKTFKHVRVLSIVGARTVPSNFVIVAANREINLDDAAAEKALKDIDAWFLQPAEIKSLKNKARGTVLTDDYVPVENLVAPVAQVESLSCLAKEYYDQAKELAERGKFDESILKYKAAMRVFPEATITACYAMGGILAKQEKWAEAVEIGKTAIEYHERSDAPGNIAFFYYNVGVSLKKISKNDEAPAYFRKAISGYRDDLAKNPNSIGRIANLGNALKENGDFAQAAKCYLQIVEKDPRDINTYLPLLEMLKENAPLEHGLYERIIEDLREGERSMMNAGKNEDALKLRKYLQLLEKNRSERGNNGK